MSDVYVVLMGNHFDTVLGIFDGLLCCSWLGNSGFGAIVQAKLAGRVLKEN